MRTNPAPICPQPIASLKLRYLSIESPLLAPPKAACAKCGGDCACRAAPASASVRNRRHSPTPDYIERRRFPAHRSHCSGARLRRRSSCVRRRYASPAVLRRSAAPTTHRALFRINGICSVSYTSLNTASLSTSISMLAMKTYFAFGCILASLVASGINWSRLSNNTSRACGFVNRVTCDV